MRDDKDDKNVDEGVEERYDKVEDKDDKGA